MVEDRHDDDVEDAKARGQLSIDVARELCAFLSERMMKISEINDLASLSVGIDAVAHTLAMLVCFAKHRGEVDNSPEGKRAQQEEILKARATIMRQGALKAFEDLGLAYMVIEIDRTNPGGG